MKRSILVILTILPLFGAQNFEDFEKEFLTTHDLVSLDLPPEVDAKDGGHPCKRTCYENEPPMECRYTFKVEEYLTLSKACYDCPQNATDCSRSHCVHADGVRRLITVVNRQLPGPAIEVCQGDRVVVDVVNGMSDRSTAIHWHGQLHRETPSSYGTPYMDGVPYVTQCPILPGHSFRYAFVASAAGTHFWHAHIAFQRADGVYGPFTVRVPSSRNLHADLYDYDEHNLMLADWSHVDGGDKFVKHYQAGGVGNAPNLLINGKGRWQGDNVSRAMPLASFTVKQYSRYRFRLVNAEYLNCPMELSVDNHTLLVVSTDGNDIEPIEVDVLTSYAGERFDFVLKANRSIGNYWIRVRGLLDCDERSTSAHQVAILHYEGAVEADPPEPVAYKYPIITKDTVVLNAMNAGMESNATVCIAVVNGTNTQTEVMSRKPDYQFFMAYDLYALDAPQYHPKELYGYYQVNKKMRVRTPQINHITYKIPPVPLMSQWDAVPSDQLCNSTSRNCDGDLCACTQTLQVKRNSLVEIVLIDEGSILNANHPLHMHGYQFYVVGMEKLGQNVTVERVKQLDAAGLLKRKLERASLKDTVTIPNGGYTILRFFADNPGYWIFHCHLEFHVEVGMAFLVKVGDHGDFPPLPRDFPKCSSYMPANPTESLEKFLH